MDVKYGNISFDIDDTNTDTDDTGGGRRGA